MEIVLSILSAVLGCSALVSYILYRNAEKRIKNAEAEKAETSSDDARFDMYEKRLQHCNEIIELHNATILNQGETVKKLTSEVDDKTMRIRQLSDQLLESEMETNRVNNVLVDATQQIGQLELQCHRYELWHCRVADCPHRVPPRPELKSQVFKEDFDPVYQNPNVDNEPAGVENETTGVENETTGSE